MRPGPGVQRELEVRSPSAQQGPDTQLALEGKNPLCIPPRAPEAGANLAYTRSGEKGPESATLESWVRSILPPHPPRAT